MEKNNNYPDSLSVPLGTCSGEHMFIIYSFTSSSTLSPLTNSYSFTYELGYHFRQLDLGYVNDNLIPSVTYNNGT